LTFNSAKAQSEDQASKKHSLNEKDKDSDAELANGSVGLRHVFAGLPVSRERFASCDWELKWILLYLQNCSGATPQEA
jgi:hypothetical protein